MKNNETKCKEVLCRQCVLVATLYHLKRFRGTKYGAHQILAVYDVRFGKGEK